MTKLPPNRALALAGALLVAAVAWSGAPAAAPKRPAAKKTAAVADSNRVLVRIGNETITRGDVQRRIDSMPEQFRGTYGTPEGRQQLIDRMVEERVWLSLANKSGVASRPQVRQQLEQQRRDLLVRTYLNEVMSSNPTPTDAEARAYYDEHLSDYKVPATVTVKHILAKTEPDAKRSLQWAKQKPKEWDALVKRYSTDKDGHATGGSLGTVTREGVFSGIGAQPALAEAAFALAEGGIGGPVKTDKGWHVIKVEAKKEESTRGFEQVRPVILRQLSSKRSQDFYKGQLDQARQKLGVRPDSSEIKRFVSQKKSARDLFNEAQALGGPEARIEAYKRLLAEHPTSDVSPQAQFMVGFIYSEELKNYDEAEKAFRDLLQRYPKAELAASAQWMIDHMRSEEAPAFINLDTDTDTTRAGAAAEENHSHPSSKAKGSGGKP